MVLFNVPFFMPLVFLFCPIFRKIRICFFTVTFENQLFGGRDRHVNNIIVYHSVLSVLKEVLKTQREEGLLIQGALEGFAEEEMKS